MLQTKNYQHWHYIPISIAIFIIFSFVTVAQAAPTPVTQLNPAYNVAGTFEISPIQGSSPLIVSAISSVTLLDDLGNPDTTTPLEYTWRVLDGRDPLVASSVEFELSEEVTYEIRLEVGFRDDNDQLILIATGSQSVEVRSNTPPIARIKGIPIDTVLTPPATVKLDASDSYDPDKDDNTLYYKWLSSDGQEFPPSGEPASQSAVTTEMSFTVAGNYTITLTVYDSSNPRMALSDSVTQVVKIGEPTDPNAFFSMTTSTPNNVVVPVQITLNPNGSSDIDGEIVKYQWIITRVDDDEVLFNKEEGSPAPITELISERGRYTIKLIVTDNDGLTSTSQQTFYAKGLEPPTAIANVTPQEGILEGEVFPVTFDGSQSYDIDDEKWQKQCVWTVDGQIVGADCNPFVYEFDRVDNYYVTLTVTDADNFKMHDSKVVLVQGPPPANLPPQADISSNINPPARNISTYPDCTVSFIPLGSRDEDGFIVEYSWDILNSSTSELASAVDSSFPVVYTNPQQAFQYIFDTAGTYSVMLTVRDDDGDPNTTHAQVRVLPKPTISAKVFPVEGRASTQFSLQATSENWVNYTWQALTQDLNPSFNPDSNRDVTAIKFSPNEDALLGEHQVKLSATLSKDNCNLPLTVTGTDGNEEGLVSFTLTPGICAVAEAEVLEERHIKGVGATIKLTGGPSSDADGVLTDKAFTWQLGDRYCLGTTVCEISRITDITPIILTVKDSDGCPSTKTVYTVYPCFPGLDPKIDLSSESILLGESINIDAIESSLPDMPVDWNYTWSVNGQPLVEYTDRTQFSYTPLQEGKYEIKLTLKAKGQQGENGCVAEAYASFEVGKIPPPPIIKIEKHEHTEQGTTIDFAVEFPAGAPAVSDSDLKWQSNHPNDQISPFACVGEKCEKRYTGNSGEFVMELTIDEYGNSSTIVTEKFDVCHPLPKPVFEISPSTIDPENSSVPIILDANDSELPIPNKDWCYKWRFIPEWPAEFMPEACEDSETILNVTDTSKLTSSEYLVQLTISTEDIQGEGCVGTSDTKTIRKGEISPECSYAEPQLCETKPECHSSEAFWTSTDSCNIQVFPSVGTMDKASEQYYSNYINRSIGVPTPDSSSINGGFAIRAGIGDSNFALMHSNVNPNQMLSVVSRTYFSPSDANRQANIYLVVGKEPLSTKCQQLASSNPPDPIIFSGGADTEYQVFKPDGNGNVLSSPINLYAAADVWLAELQPLKTITVQDSVSQSPHEMRIFLQDLNNNIFNDEGVYYLFTGYEMEESNQVRYVSVPVIVGVGVDYSVPVTASMCP